MIILGIETSCDETAISLIETQEKDGELQFKILNNSVVSQIKLHEQYGGVFPMMAKREHAKNLVPLLLNVLKDTNFLPETTSAIDPVLEGKVKALLSEKEKELLENLLRAPQLFNALKIDVISVTQGPGLEPALWVGINFAKALGLLWNIPVIPTNHMEGHIVATLLKDESQSEYHSLKKIEFPALALLISGGHTELVLIKNHRDYEIIGKTRDDAVGEAFDKVARLLGLPYPGGPQISKLAQKERAVHATSRNTYVLPRPMIRSNDFDFSFSGIKTAVLYMTKEIPELNDEIKQQIAREFEDAVTEVLLSKTKAAIEEHGAQTLIVGGGVSANSNIRAALEEMTRNLSIPLLLPSQALSTDNALMIAIAGAFINKGDLPNIQEFKAEGNLSLS